MWAMARSQDVAGSGDAGTVFTARTRSRNSVLKSSSLTSCKKMDWCEGSEASSAAFEGGSQRSETPFWRRASATGGRIKDSTSSWTRRLSTALHAAGYPTLASTMTLIAISTLASACM